MYIQKKKVVITLVITLDVNTQHLNYINNWSRRHTFVYLLANKITHYQRHYVMDTSYLMDEDIKLLAVCIIGAIKVTKDECNDDCYSATGYRVTYLRMYILHVAEVI